MLILGILLIGSFGDLRDLIEKQPELKHVQYDIYGCCGPEKSVLQWIEDGWTVTDMYWDSCGNIYLELSK